MVTGRYSSGLVREIDALIDGRITNVFAIFDEIAALEGKSSARRSRTKPAETFKGKHLRGFWHKHYFRSGIDVMIRNITNYWSRAERLSRMMKKEFDGRRMSAEEFAKQFSYRYVFDGYKGHSRNRDITGDWIVFTKQSGINYYLTLADHEEDAAVIWKRCKNCLRDFPCLQVLREERST